MFLGTWDIISDLNAGSSASTISYDLDLDGTFDFVIPPFNDPTPPSANRSGELFQFGEPLRFDPDLKLPANDRFQVGFTTVLPLNLLLDATFNYNILKNRIRTFNDNNIFVDGEFVGLKDTRYERTNWVTNDIWSSQHYRSLELTVTKELRDNWMMFASYSYNDNIVKGTYSPFEPLYYRVPLDWFEANDFSPTYNHQIRVVAQVILPYDISTAVNFTWRDGERMFYPTTLATDNPPRFVIIDGKRLENPLFETYLPFQARSDEREKYHGMTNINLDIGKDFSLQGRRLGVRLQIFNLLNLSEGVGPRYNRVDANGNLTEADQQEFFSIQYPQSMQLLFKYDF